MRKIFILMLCMLFLVANIQADIFTFDNVKNYDAKTKTIDIRNSILGIPFLQLDKVAEYQLTYNTDQCLIDCSAEGVVTTYTKGQLFSDMKFLDSMEKETNIQEYTIYVWTEETELYDVADYKDVCKIVVNGTICNPEFSGVHQEERIKSYWKEYEGEELDPGEYKWKLEGKKNIHTNVDWVGSAFGIELEDWAWWNTDWARRREINITGGTGQLLDFPALFNVSYDSDMLPDFEDIRIVNGSCGGTQDTELSYEFDSVKNSSFALMWIKIPVLNTGDNLHCLYYDNSGAGNGEDITDVWDSDYLHIYHNTNWSKSVLTFSIDSTNAYNATPLNMDNGNFYSGRIGTSLNFNGVDEFEMVDTSKPTTPFIEAWVYLTYGAQYQHIYSSDDLGGGTSDRSWQFQADSAQPTMRVFTGAGTITSVDALNISGGWHYVVGSYNGTSAMVCVDDRSCAVVGGGNTMDDIDGGIGMGIASYDADHGQGDIQLFGGQLDEIRVSNLTRSSTYINRSYKNGDSTMFSIGAEEENLGVTATQSYQPDGYNSTTNTVGLGANFTGVGSENISAVVLMVYDSSDNLDYTNTIGSLNQKNYNATWTTSALDDDTYLWSVEGRGSQGNNQTSGNRTFYVDATLPSVNITYPINSSTYTTGFASGNTLPIMVNWTATDSHIQACKLFNSSSNQTITCYENMTWLNVTYASHNFIVWVNDSYGNENSYLVTANYNYSLLQNSESYNSSAYETSRQSFIVNLSSNIQNVLSVTSKLNYSNTLYTASSSCYGSECLLNADIDLPLIPSNQTRTLSFNWQISIYNGSNQYQINTSASTQVVSMIHLHQCNATWVNRTANYSVYDEQNLSRVNPFKLGVTYDYWLGFGSVKRNSSVQNDTTPEVSICKYPDGIDFHVDGTLAYNDIVNVTYYERNYYYQNDTFNTTNQQTFLYLLNQGSSTSFILKVQDDNLLPLSDYLIYIERFYPGENKFRTVQVAKTDNNGQTIGFFEAEIADYRFTIKKDGDIKLQTPVRKVVGESAPFTITFTIGESLGKPWESVEDIEDLNSTLVYNKTTGVVTFTYIDDSTDFERGRLLVRYVNFSGSKPIICNETSTQPTASITCNVGVLTGNSTGTFEAIGYVKRAGSELVAKTIGFIVENARVIVGMLGILMGWFIILVSAFTFKFNEIAGIWMVNLAVIFVSVIGLISFGMVFITAMIAISILITVLMRN